MFSMDGVIANEVLADGGGSGRCGVVSATPTVGS